MKTPLARRLLPALAALAAVAWTQQSAAAENARMTVLFTGDNGGEIAPCG